MPSKIGIIASTGSPRVTAAISLTSPPPKAPKPDNSRNATNTNPAAPTLANIPCQFAVARRKITPPPPTVRTSQFGMIRLARSLAVDEIRPANTSSFPTTMNAMVRLIDTAPPVVARQLVARASCSSSATGLLPATKRDVVLQDGFSAASAKSPPTGRLNLAGDGIERRAQVGADQRHCGDDDHGYQRRNQ